MKKAPKISVIIPSYCHEQFIGEAVESVINQTFTDFELLVIDDKSKDNSLEILKQFDDSRIVIHTNNENMGSVHTINRGLKYACGEYIAILNSDDVFTPERLERCLHECDTTGNILTGTDIRLVDEFSDEIDNKIHWWIEWYEYLKNNYFESKDLLQAMLSGNLFISTSNFFFKKEVIDKIGLFQDLKFVQDYDFLLRIFATFGNKISWIPEKLLYYRLHKSNTIRSNALESNRETLKILLRWLPEYAENKPMKGKLATFTKHLSTISGHIEHALTESIHEKNYKNETLLRNEIEETHKNWRDDVKKLRAELENSNNNWAENFNLKQKELESTHHNWQKDVKNFQHEIQETHKNWRDDVKKLRAELENSNNNWAENFNLKQKELESTHHNWQKDVKNFQHEIEETHKNWRDDVKKLRTELENSNNNWAENFNLKQKELESTHHNWQKDVKNFQHEIEKIHKQWQQDALRLNQQLARQDEILVSIKKQWIDETSKLHEIILSRSKDLQVERDYFVKEKNELLTIIEEKNRTIEDMTTIINKSKNSIFHKLFEKI